ncbi:ENTH domain-containing protein 1 isoform X2 [Erinaceus europaeus]|uniref:ENTH domain-containing protein 1 isoform X2 n=1 Tax=Erinaceus europaeus TaxID=9365 RepID=A0ABM3XDI1_ERIEU|nr:ENTH domain-containing protein 1 isoform X2 [Erinaceus europaeus]
MAFRRQVKNFVKNYSDAEIKVREATSNDPWGPSSSLMLDISDLTFNTISLSEIMNMLWQRLNDHGKNWRHVYKSLTLMDYLIKNGSKKVIQHCREGFCNLQTLKEFQHIDEAGKDQENASKVGLRQEQSQDIQLPSGTVLTQETLPLKVNAWKSTEDLMLFSEEDPKPLLPTVPPSGVSSITWLSEGHEDISNLWDSDTVPTPSEKSLSLQTNLSSDKKSDSTITNIITENSLQTPLEKQPTAKSVEMLTSLPALGSSSKEEFISSNLRISKSDSTFYNQASVETLYVSPSLKTFDPAKETAINKSDQKPTQSSNVQMDDGNRKALATWVSTASEETCSFSTLSVSSPDSAVPEKSVHLLPPILSGPSFWTLSRPQSSSAFFKDKSKTARVHHLFAPRGTVSSDEEESDNFNLLEIFSDNPDSTKKKTGHMTSSNLVEFSTQNVDHFTSVSCSSLQATKCLPAEPEASNSIKVLLGEVKNAIVKLHEDLSMVIRELNIINSHLVSMSGNSPQGSKSLHFPQSPEGNLDQI